MESIDNKYISAFQAALSQAEAAQSNLDCGPQYVVTDPDFGYCHVDASNPGKADLLDPAFYQTIVIQLIEYVCPEIPGMP